MKEEGSNEFTITLQATAAGAWDGKTQTEPQTDENGVYQIGTGAELAWFVAKSKDADVSGVLTARYQPRQIRMAEHLLQQEGRA